MRPHTDGFLSRVGALLRERPVPLHPEMGRNAMSKCLFVIGGMASSGGKEISVASLGRLLKKPRVCISFMK